MSNDEFSDLLVRANPFLGELGIILLGAIIIFFLSNLSSFRNVAFRTPAAIIGAILPILGFYWMIQGMVHDPSMTPSAIILSAVLGLLLSFGICFWPMFRHRSRHPQY